MHRSQSEAAAMRPQVLLDVLLADPTDGHDLSLAGGDADANRLAQEDALGVPPSRRCRKSARNALLSSNQLWMAR